MHLGAVKAAATSELIACTVAAAANAQGLLDDAEVLFAAGPHARAYSLAALAVEEVGKAASLAALAVMPQKLRAQAPVGRMLGWHQLKVVGGRLIAVVPFGPPAMMPFGSPTVATTRAAMPAHEVAEILNSARSFAQDEDRLKQRGLYVDMDRYGRVRQPSEVTAAEVSAQLDRARQAASSAKVLLSPCAQNWLANPRAHEIELSCALVSAFAEAGYARTPEAAADLVMNAVSKLRAQMTASDVNACHNGHGGYRSRSSQPLNRNS